MVVVSYNLIGEPKFQEHAGKAFELIVLDAPRAHAPIACLQLRNATC